MKTRANDTVSPNSTNVISLTKREYFAAMALQGFLAGGFYEAGVGTHEERTSDHAVRYADALIKELNKEIKK